MTSPDKPIRQAGRLDIVALGFGQTVVMWAVGYVCRLWPGAVPSWLVLVLLLVCMLAGGAATGLLTRRGVRGGAWVGIVSAVLNLMILGSLLGGDRPNVIRPSMVLWIPGSIALGASLGTIGAALTGRSGRREPPKVNWLATLASIAVAACFILLTAGGLVTSKEAGLAVVDWPNSFGYNMFLYPLSRMTGGIYYEHTHRLLGSLLGLTVIVLTVCVWRSDAPHGVKALIAVVLLLVVFQGILGGLRVTGRFTLSTDRAIMAPSIRLAAMHGVVGQTLFALLACTAALISDRWRSARRPEPLVPAETDRALLVALLIVLTAQLVFGAILRHTYVGVPVHVTFGVLVGVLALACGLRLCGLYASARLRRMGLVLLVATGMQIVLGVAALIVTGSLVYRKPPPPIEVVLATAHQVVGAILLAWSSLLILWHRRLTVPIPMQGSSRSGI